ncbi:NAD(P)-dependent oxidoreductase [Frankia sp. AgB32]|uniref:NAD-dependent epimerase/dehydratase family protein n=1 Tax=Frankia sp. AgB32 TaxID=631119 RepID=UPI00200D9EB5|nr:NAD(P)-dependent oxidoreductase [Frankia sp. AgB32]MCK9896403.1 NAD(P)-dependent oxidoreductase [Frankia sp. AgB32]
MSRVAVFGASGFIGTACANALTEAGHEVVRRPARRLRADLDMLSHPARSALAPEPAGAGLAALVADLAGMDAVVNAAGVATSAASLTPALVGGNAAWPQLLADACAHAGVPRLLHVSTAAVQGRALRLDESLDYAPVTPYARAKMLGEQLLRDAAARGQVAVTLYRPPSVHGWGRRMTSDFAAFCRRWPLVACDSGDQPVPVALVGNVGAAVAAILAAEHAPLVVAHPSEGHTVRSLYQTFAPGRPLCSLPAPAVRALLHAAEPTGQWLAPLGALCRRAELLLLGQAQEPGWLPSVGFAPPLGRAAWDELAAAVRAEADAAVAPRPTPGGPAAQAALVGDESRHAPDRAAM